MSVLYIVKIVFVFSKSRAFKKNPRNMYGITIDCIELDTTLSKYMEKPIPAMLDSAIIPVNFTKVLLLRRATFDVTFKITVR